MQSLHRHELRRQELISGFGSNLRNRKTPTLQLQSESIHQNPIVSKVIRKVKTCQISQRYRPIAGTCLSRKTIARGKKNQEDEDDCYEELSEIGEQEMGLPMKARSRMMMNRRDPRNVYDANPLLRPLHDPYLRDEMLGGMDDDDDDLDDEDSDEVRSCSSRFIPKTTTGQRMKFGLAVLMIPSLIVIMNGHKKFNSSNSNVDYSGMAGAGAGGLGAMGGMGHGIGGHGMGGFGGRTGAGGGVGGLPGSEIPGDPLEALGYPGSRLGKGRKGKGKRGGKSRKGSFDPYGDSLEGKMKQMMGGIPGIDAQEQLEKIQQLQDQYARSRSGMMANGVVENSDDDYATDGDDDGDVDAVAVDDSGAEVELDGGMNHDYMESFGGIGGIDYANQFLDIPKRAKHSSGNPNPGLKSEVETTVSPPPEIVLTEKLSAADVPTLKTIGYKVVLVWSDDVHFNEIPLGINSFIESGCDFTKCVVTRNKSYEFLSDALIIEPSGSKLPTSRSPDQVWILYYSNPDNKFDIQVKNLVINMTWSFAPNSNITTYTTKREVLTKDSFKTLSPELGIIFKSKKLKKHWGRKRKESKHILLWTSSCGNTDHPLLNLLQSNGLEVEIVSSCPHSNVCSLILDEDTDVPFHLTMTEDECYKKLLGDSYLFALIEGNSTTQCSNYVNPKLVAALETTSIPIASVSSFEIVPGEGILNRSSLDDETMIHKIKSIINDFEQFLSFLDWKKTYRVVSNRNDSCKLCRLLHEEPKNEGYEVERWLKEVKNCNN